MSRRILTIIAVNLVVFCALAELLGLAAHYVEYGSLFYTDSPHYKPVADASEQRLTGDALHPYFGPTHNEGMPFNLPASLRETDRDVPEPRTNNFGFVSPFNYPFAASGSSSSASPAGRWAVVCEAGAPAPRIRAATRSSATALAPMCLSHEGASCRRRRRW